MVYRCLHQFFKIGGKDFLGFFRVLINLFAFQKSLIFIRKLCTVSAVK